MAPDEQTGEVKLADFPQGSWVLVHLLCYLTWVTLMVLSQIVAATWDNVFVGLSVATLADGLGWLIISFIQLTVLRRSFSHWNKRWLLASLQGGLIGGLIGWSMGLPVELLLSDDYARMVARQIVAIVALALSLTLFQVLEIRKWSPELGRIWARRSFFGITIPLLIYSAVVWWVNPSTPVVFAWLYFALAGGLYGWLTGRGLDRFVDIEASRPYTPRDATI